MEESLLYNIGLISAIQQPELAIGIHITFLSLLNLLPPLTFSTPLGWKTHFYEKRLHETCPRWAVWPFSFRELHCNTLQTLKFVWMAGPGHTTSPCPRLFYFCVLPVCSLCPSSLLLPTSVPSQALSCPFS